MTTQFTRRAIIVVTAAHLTNANNKAAEVDLVGGDKAFHAKLSATGADPATHYWCNWAFTTAQIAAILNKLNFTQDGTTGHYTNGLGDHGYDFTKWTPEQVLADLGLQPVTESL